MSNKVRIFRQLPLPLSCGGIQTPAATFITQEQDHDEKDADCGKKERKEKEMNDAKNMKAKKG